MNKQPSNNPNQDESPEAINIQSIKEEWEDILSELQQTKANVNDKDVITQLEYLTLCDQTSLSIAQYLKDFNQQIQVLENPQKAEHIQDADYLLATLKDLRNQMKVKLDQLTEEYTLLAEETLRTTQDTITNYSSKMEQEKLVPKLQADIRQNLDKDLYLQELRDTLETYRQAREELISEGVMEYFQKLPEIQIPEDLGEETPEMDSILSQLDTAITACDQALIIREITD